MASQTDILPSDKIGDWLVSLGMVTRRQLAAALELSEAKACDLQQALLDQRFVTAEELNGASRLQRLLSSVGALAEFPVEEDVLPLIPEPVARQKAVLPLMKVGERLAVVYGREASGTVRDHDVKLLDQVSHLTGLLVVGVGLSRELVLDAIDPIYGRNSAKGLMDAALKLSGTLGESRVKEASAIDRPSEDGDAPIVELVNQILGKAIDSGASDLHLEPFEQKLEARLRIDGVLHTVMVFPKQVESAVISRVKILCDMNIAERRRPQDGRFSVRHQGQKIDFRVAVIACHWGEKVVMRLLRPKTISLGLEALGFSTDDLTRLTPYINAPNGIMLVTGPTGSGKTSTLYASLAAMDKHSDSIVTIEDPVEFPVEGITQIQANAKIGLTFAAALRTILRLDPDTIMLGEIRDKETGEIAIEAALTGHMVLSTLHTNSTVETVGRLIDMGIPPYMVSATLLCVVAQRLVRKICRGCYQEYPADREEKAFLGKLPGEAITLARGAGCEICNGTGFKGQLGVFEILEVTRRIKELINQQASSIAMLDAACEGGMLTLLDDGKRKVLARQTSVDEIVRVLGSGLKDE
ncbi:MAG: ATPase, T2SS/T4P/T4SS family [Candidatus Sericytochromatia bacterium]|nr:ATPase, T2SS/T4P/T4SS family [Candidatus Sericytochromatia bacterium]